MLSKARVCSEHDTSALSALQCLSSWRAAAAANFTAACLRRTIYDGRLHFLLLADNKQAII